MSSGCYFPKAVKLMKTPKSNGGTRPLGIPTIGDKIIQNDWGFGDNSTYCPFLP